MTSSSFRTHTCGELNSKDIKKEVKLCGWINTRRDHGGIIFIDLRDRYGFTQIVLDPSKLKEADKLRREWCIQVSGSVRSRPKGMENKNMFTGEIEVEIKSLNILNESEVPPFEIDGSLRGPSSFLSANRLGWGHPGIEDQQAAAAIACGSGPT